VPAVIDPARAPGGGVKSLAHYAISDRPHQHAQIFFPTI